MIENFGINDELQVDVAHLMSHGIIPHGDRNGPLHRVAQNLAWYRDHAGVDIRGQFAFTKDPVMLGKVDMTDI